MFLGERVQLHQRRAISRWWINNLAPCKVTIGLMVYHPTGGFGVA